MEVETIIYKAKDGRTFTDPLACEDYEKTLGIVPNSVGNLVQLLEKKDPNDYIFGIVLIKDKDEYNACLKCTVCLDDKLEDFVSPDALTEEQRYMSETIGEFLKFLRKKDQDSPCQWFIAYSSELSMGKCGMMANFNRKCWPSNAKDL